MDNGVRVELKIPKKLLDKLDRVVELQFETRSAVIRSALRDYLDKRLLMLGDKNDY